MFFRSSDRFSRMSYVASEIRADQFWVNSGIPEFRSINNP